MAQFGLNVSTSQLEKLKNALKTTDASKLERAQLTGNAASIFNEFNVSSDNIFKDTGLDKILNDIAGEDGQISQNEMQNFLGDEVFSMDSFLSVVEDAIDESLNENKIQSTSTTSSYRTTSSSTAPATNTSMSRTDSADFANKSGSTSPSVNTTKKDTSFNMANYTSPSATRGGSTAAASNSSVSVKGTTPQKSIKNSFTNPDRGLIKDLETELSSDSDLAKAVRYQNDGSAVDGVATESKAFIADRLQEIIDDNDCGIEDLTIAGGADFLKDVSNSLKNYNVEDFNIDKDNISPEFIAILSNAYADAPAEAKDGNTLLGRLYNQTQNFITSQTSNPEMFEAYIQQMGSIDSGFDNDKKMTLEEMSQNVDKFNQILSLDEDFYDKYATKMTTQNGKTVYMINDAQRAQIISDENKLLGDNRAIVEDSDYTMKNPDALTWADDDSFFDKFGKSAATINFVADGGWKNYNALNKEYLNCQDLCNQFNEQGYVEYQGKRYDSSNAQSFIDAVNTKVENIQKQKDEIERTESYNAAVAATAGEIGWEATKFGLGIVSGGAVQVTLIAADAAIAAHDTFADGGTWDEALFSSITNAAGNVLGNAAGDFFFPGANNAATEITERATERLTSEATERIATEVAENIAEATARRIAQETGEQISQEAAESAMKKFITEKIKYDLGNEVQSINEDFFNGAYEEIKAEITGESSSEA